MYTIAERHLELRTPKGSMAVVAALGRPTEVGAEEWTCACVTVFGGEARTHQIHGGDSMQALQLAMVTLDVELSHGAKMRGGTLFQFDEPFTSVLEDSGMQPRSTSASPGAGAI
ncbi:DUF6968 family protein [Aquimonas voraii]|uniref:DUF6968 family protein n=1 Tax=Aquimonas voraii TaxID=265719 RepID=UPI003CCB8A6A